VCRTHAKRAETECEQTHAGAPAGQDRGHRGHPLHTSLRPKQLSPFQPAATRRSLFPPPSLTAAIHVLPPLEGLGVGGAAVVATAAGGDGWVGVVGAGGDGWVGVVGAGKGEGRRGGAEGEACAASTVQAAMSVAGPFLLVISSTHLCSA
jgi:hypothetical protein